MELLHHIVIWIHMITWISSNLSAVSGSVGSVVIGTPGEESTSLSFSNNDLQSDQWFIQVYLQVVNQSSGEFISVDNNVTVSCDLAPKWSGYSSVVFESQTVEAPNASAPNFTAEPLTVRIYFRDLKVGRAVQVRCWGESVIDALDPGENGTQDHPQFTKEGSMSKPVLFTIYHKGTVNICDSRVMVPFSENAKDSTSRFLIELSDPVETNTSVLVTCSITPQNASDPDDVLTLSIQYPIEVTENEKKIEVIYTRIDGSKTVLVACYGQSIFVIGNDTYNGTQYTPETSRGDPVPFILDQGYVSMYPQASLLRRSEMKLFIVLDAEVTTDVTFTCRAETVQSSEEAIDIAENPYCQSITETVVERPYTNNTDGGVPTTAAPRNVTGEWRVREPKLIFQVGKDRYKELIIERKSYPTQQVDELVVVTCCAPVQSVNPKYRGKSAAALVLTALTPNITVNWTYATLQENEVKETTIQNPAYVKLAPCPCDLTKASCDNNCCCDTDCSASQKELFTCIPGIEGGFPALMPTYSCASRSVTREDWFPFMCVHKENSAFLGYYFPNILGIRSEVDFKSKVQGIQPPNSYRETEERSQFRIGRPYRSGSDIKTGLVAKQVEDNIIPNKNFILGLPQKSLLGDCVKTAPVQYLVDVDSQCTHTVLEDLCTAMSPLSALIYAQSTQISKPPCPKAPVIIADGGTEKVTKVDAHYLCTDDASSYLRSTATISDLYNMTGKSLFSDEINTENCDFDPETKAFICAGIKTNTSNEGPPRCDWDDGYTPPPSPTYNAITGVCENAVVDIHYNFTWKGSEILLLNATYILGDLPLELERVDSYSYDFTEKQSLNDIEDNSEGTTAGLTVTPAATTTPSVILTSPAPDNTTEGVDTTAAYDASTFSTNVSVVVTKYPAVLGQKIKVIFWPDHPINNTSANETSQTERYQRSGKVGYVNDFPVFSGIPVWNSSNDALGYIDTKESARLALWSPAAGGLCAESSRQVVNFRQNTLSSCALRIGLTELYDGCENLRKQVLHFQDALMPASVVSRNGDPNITSLSQWISIIRQNLSSIIPPTEVTTTTEPPVTTESVTTDSSVITTSEPPYEVTTANVTDNTTEGGIVIDTSTIGRCMNIPSGIHVDIMYAVAGAVNSQPFYEIVGAKISYALSTWSLDCSASNGAACLGNLSQVATDNNGEEAVQTFTLTSSVNFHLVPGKEEPPKTRYQEQKAQPFPYCKGDACWEELFYPFTSAFKGDPLQYMRAVTLTCIVILIGYLFVTRPWW